MNKSYTLSLDGGDYYWKREAVVCCAFIIDCLCLFEHYELPKRVRVQTSETYQRDWNKLTFDAPYEVRVNGELRPVFPFVIDAINKTKKKTLYFRISAIKPRKSAKSPKKKH